jgi:hypothetical protein
VQFVPSKGGHQIRTKGEIVTKLDQASVQGMLDAAEARDYGPVFESFAENVLVENGPGAGPWWHAEGRDDFANVLLEFSAFFAGTFRQRGRCIYADDRVVINMIEETGTSPAGDTFDNLAVYVTRVGINGKADRLWTVDLDTDIANYGAAQTPCGRHGEAAFFAASKDLDDLFWGAFLTVATAITAVSTMGAATKSIGN